MLLIIFSMRTQERNGRPTQSQTSFVLKMTQIIRMTDQQLSVKNFSDLSDGVKINYLVASIFGPAVFVNGLSATDDRREKQNNLQLLQQMYSEWGIPVNFQPRKVAAVDYSEMRSICRKLSILYDQKLLNDQKRMEEVPKGMEWEEVPNRMDLSEQELYGMQQDQFDSEEMDWMIQNQSKVLKSEDSEERDWQQLLIQYEREKQEEMNYYNQMYSQFIKSERRGENVDRQVDNKIFEQRLKEKRHKDRHKRFRTVPTILHDLQEWLYRFNGEQITEMDVMTQKYQPINNQHFPDQRVCILSDLQIICQLYKEKHNLSGPIGSRILKQAVVKVSRESKRQYRIIDNRIKSQLPGLNRKTVMKAMRDHHDIVFKKRRLDQNLFYDIQRIEPSLMQQKKKQSEQNFVGQGNMNMYSNQVALQGMRQVPNIAAKWIWNEQENNIFDRFCQNPQGFGEQHDMAFLIRQKGSYLIYERMYAKNQTSEIVLWTFEKIAEEEEALKTL